MSDSQTDWKSLCESADKELHDKPVVYQFGERKFLDPEEEGGAYAD